MSTKSGPLHTNVIVLEANDRVGGKAWSTEKAGVPFNLGACYVTTGYGLTRRWLKEFGIVSKRQVKPIYEAKDGSQINYTRYLFEETSALSGLAQCLKYCRLWADYYIKSEVRRDISPEFAKTLSTPAVRWFREKNIPFLIKPCRRGYQTMGYGVLEEIPILHLMRWVTPTLLMSGILNFLFEVRNFESLFVQIAKDCDVRLNTRVQHISKDGDGFSVMTDQGAYQFDYVVHSSFLDDVDGLESINPDVAAVKLALEYKLWIVKLVDVRRRCGDAFYDHEIVNYPDAWENVEPGKVVGFRKSIFEVPGEEATQARTHTYLAGQLYFDEALYSPAHAKERLMGAIERRGGELRGVEEVHVARYAPTYKSEAIRDGIVSTMRRMQGKSGLYFAGSTFSHESVKSIVNFNRFLADKIDADIRAESRSRRFQLRTAAKRLLPFNL